MAITRIADILIPEIWNPYVREMTAENSRLFQSGALVADSVIDGLIARGGDSVNLPFWKDLGSDGTTDGRQTDNPASSLTPGKIEADKELAPVLRRVAAFGAADIAESLAGDDPLRVAVDRFAEFWNRRFNAIAIAAIQGALDALDSASPSGEVTGIHDVSLPSGGKLIDADVVIDAKQAALGDNADVLTLMFVHSKVYARLQSQNLIDFIPDARGEVVIPTYQGMTLIVTDTLPTDPGSGDLLGTYDSYVAGPGALRYGEADAKVPIEFEREALQGDGGGTESLVHRRNIVIHPTGFQYSGSVANNGPTNVSLATGGNWTPVFERKNIPLVGIRTNG